MAKSSFFSGTGTTANDVNSVTSSKAAAEAAATNAATSATNASSSATNAATSATNASNSASSAQTSATNAATSETSASSSQTAAAASQSAAATSATNAATSETNAATSASNAATSASSAAASAASVATEAADAAASAAAAATSETNAAASASTASTAATTATTGATTATTGATTATTAAANASTSETNASASATSAANDATTASTAATNASTSAANAATSATNAASSATAAAASQTAAAASAASAATAYDAFDDRYLGSKTVDPTLDNDGQALVAGALYFNSLANEMRVYDGANWIAATSAGNASLLEYNYTATAAQTTFSGADDNANTLSYTQDNLIVTLNGVVLENGADYTATTGTSVVLSSGAALNDELNIIAFKSFTTADMVPASTGGTFYNDVSIQGNLSFGDNNKAIFGASSDLQIYHDGSNSWVRNFGSGSLYISGDADGDVYIQGKAGENSLACYNDGAVALYYDNAIKLATTSTGIDVTGTVSADNSIYLNSTSNALIKATAASGSNSSLSLLEAGTGNVGAEFQYDGSANILNVKVGNNTDLTRMSIARDTGDISFYNTSGNAKFFWDASAESLGIGTSSPSSILHIEGNTSSYTTAPILYFGSTSTADSAIRDWAIGPADDSYGNFHIFRGTSTGSNAIGNDGRVFTISSSGNVGIGTSSPNSPLEVSNGTENHRVAFGTGEVYLMARNASSYITQEYIANQHVFTGYGDSSSNEALRIDASGNLLVGTTSSFGSSGITLGSNVVYAAASSQNVANFQRYTTDGEIVRFGKDGTTVGSIGAQTRTGSTELGIGTGDTGLNFFDQGNAICPVNMDNGFDRDGAIDLGRTGVRFKDLYLSGGVYLGGTGAANKLDDYEEGTWTPTMHTSDANLTATIGIQFARYVKIGQLVYVSAYIVPSITAGSSGYAYLSSLPFAVSSAAGAVFPWFCVHGTALSSSGGYLGGNGRMIAIANNSTSGINWNAGIQYLMFNCSYMTDA